MDLTAKGAKDAKERQRSEHRLESSFCDVVSVNADGAGGFYS